MRWGPAREFLPMPKKPTDRIFAFSESRPSRLTPDKLDRAKPIARHFAHFGRRPHEHGVVRSIRQNEAPRAQHVTGSDPHVVPNRHIYADERALAYADIS